MAENNAYRHKSQFARDVLNSQYDTNRALEAGRRDNAAHADRAHEEAIRGREQTARLAAHAREQQLQLARQAHDDSQEILQAQHVLAANQAIGNAITRAGFSRVSDELGTITGQLQNMGDQIAHLVTLQANPIATEVAELFRAGINSLQQGWYDEAADYLGKAVARLQTEGILHLALGMAQARRGDHESAFGSFAKALKYARSDSALPLQVNQAALAASAALQMQAVAKPEDADMVDAAISAALAKAPEVAELHLARGQLTSEPAHLREAFRRAPELALVAAASEVAHTAAAAREVYEDPEGPIQARLNALRCANQIGLSHSAPADLASAMTGHAHWLSDEAATLRAGAEKVLSDLHRCEEAVKDGIFASLEADRRAEAAEQAADRATTALSNASPDINWIGLWKPGIALAFTLTGANAGGGGGYFVAFVGVIMLVRWGRRWYQEYAVTTSAHGSMAAKLLDARNHATLSAQATSAALGSTQAQLAQAEAEVVRLRQQAELARQVLHFIALADTENGRIRPLFT